jgi:hypothetical protein
MMVDGSGQKRGGERVPDWVMPVFVALLVLSFALTPPTFLVNRALGRWRARRIIPEDAQIIWNGELLSAASADHVRRAWNAAHVIAVDAMVNGPTKRPIQLRVVQGSGERTWSLLAEDAFVLVRRTDGRLRRWQRLEAPELSRLCAHHTHNWNRLGAHIRSPSG